MFLSSHSPVPRVDWHGAPPPPLACVHGTHPSPASTGIARRHLPSLAYLASSHARSAQGRTQAPPTPRSTTRVGARRYPVPTRHRLRPPLAVHPSRMAVGQFRGLGRQWAVVAITLEFSVNLYRSSEQNTRIIILLMHHLSTPPYDFPLGLFYTNHQHVNLMTKYQYWTFEWVPAQLSITFSHCPNPSRPLLYQRCSGRTRTKPKALHILFRRRIDVRAR